MGALFDADTDQIAYGDVTTFDARAALTVAFWAKLDSVANAATGRRWISKWGAGLADTTLLVAQGDGAGTTLVGAVSNSSGSDYSIATEAAMLATGSTWLNYIITWTQGAPNVWEIYLSNVAQGPAVSGPGVGSTASCATGFTIGQSGVSANGILGSLAEIGVWSRVISASERITLAAGYRPADLSSGLLYYAPLLSDTVSVVGPQPTGSTGITFTDHPPMIHRASGMFVGAVSTFTVGTGHRRTLSDLGTRIASRQFQEAEP